MPQTNFDIEAHNDHQSVAKTKRYLYNARKFLLWAVFEYVALTTFMTAVVALGMMYHMLRSWEAQHSCPRYKPARHSGKWYWNLMINIYVCLTLNVYKRNGSDRVVPALVGFIEMCVFWVVALVMWLDLNCWDAKWARGSS